VTDNYEVVAKGVGGSIRVDFEVKVCLIQRPK